MLRVTAKKLYFWSNKHQAKLVNIVPVSNESASKEDYEKVINDLRGQLSAKNQDLKYLREKYRVSK